MAKKPGAGGVRTLLGKDKFKHGSAAVVLTALFIAAVVLVNVIVSVLTTRFPSMNIDLTPEKLNSLSEDAIEVAKNVSRDTKIYFIGAEERYRQDQLYSNYGLKFSQVSNLADRMQEINGHISVEYIDPDLNPQFIARYADDNLSSGKIVVESDLRHKTLDADDLFALRSDSQTGATQYYSTADGALANALYLVNLDDVPVVAIATGHSEMLNEESGNLTSFTSLLEDNNFEVKTFNLLSEEIPEGARMVFFGVPTTDFSKEEIDKLSAYLDDETMETSHTLYFVAYPSQDWSNMKNLSTFLEEWGLAVQSNVVLESDMNNVLSTYNADPSMIFANVNHEEKEEILTGTYNYLLMPSAVPVERLFTANSDIVTYSVAESADTAYVLTEEMAESGQLPEDPETEKQTIVALSQRYMNSYGSVRSNIVMDGSAMHFLRDYLASSTFANRAFTVDLVKLLSDVSDARLGLSIKQTQFNTIDITASAQVMQFVGLYLFTIAVPAAVLIVGLVIFLKRRHL